MSEQKQTLLDPNSLVEPQNVELHGLRFVLTCGACPEQYDVFLGDKQIGYVRLRHGELSVETPDCGGALVLEHEFDDGLLGQFESAVQRYGWIQKAALALLTAPGTKAELGDGDQSGKGAKG